MRSDRFRWQTENLIKYRNRPAAQRSWFIEGCTGSGKTTAAGMCYKHSRDDGEVDFILAAGPSDQVKRDYRRSFKKRLGLDITTTLRTDQPVPREYAGAIVNYHQLPRLVETLRTWVNNGLKLALHPDEMHHLIDKEDEGGNVWSGAIEEISAFSRVIIGTSATLFRADQRRISFLKYDDNGKAVPDHRYSYEDAVTDGVCKPVQFLLEDGLATATYGGQPYECRVSDAVELVDRSRVARTIFCRTDSSWLNAALTRGRLALDNTRISYPPAGMLVVGPRESGDNTGYDERVIKRIAALAGKILGCRVPYVVHDSDDNAALVIDRFRESSDPAIAAIRMITEGVDIVRLAVLVMAFNTNSELLFRQIVGRILRAFDGDDSDPNYDPGFATVIIPKFPHYVEWAQRIRDEAEAGLRRKKTTTDGHTPGEGKEFVPIADLHEQGGAISWMGSQYEAAEIEAAERLLHKNPVLRTIKVTQIAEIWRQRPDAFSDINDQPEEEKPLEEQKDDLRKSMDSLVSRLGAIRQSRQPMPDKTLHYRRVRTALNKELGVESVDDLMDNHPIELARQGKAILEAWIRDAVAT